MLWIVAIRLLLLIRLAELVRLLLVSRYAPAAILPPIPCLIAPNAPTPVGI